MFTRLKNKNIRYFSILSEYKHWEGILLTKITRNYTYNCIRVQLYIVSSFIIFSHLIHNYCFISQIILCSIRLVVSSWGEAKREQMMSTMMMMAHCRNWSINRWSHIMSVMAAHMMVTIRRSHAVMAHAHTSVMHASMMHSMAGINGAAVMMMVIHD